MIRLFAIALLSASSMHSAFATEFSFQSEVDKVTVFPRGASVTRLAEGQIPVGDHVIVISGLPQDVQPDSVRVKGTGSGKTFQNSVDVKQISISDDAQPGERLRLERQIESLQAESSRLDRRLSDNELQRQLLQGLAARAMAPVTNDNGTVALSGEALTQLLESTAKRLDALGQSEMDALARQRSISREINDLHNKIAELAPKNRIETIVSINLTVETQSESRFEIEYKIDQAGWQPLYDANLVLGATAEGATVELNRRAQVRNASGETWDDVKLALSTARPSSETSAPALESFEIDELPDVYQQDRKRMLESGLVLMDQLAAAPGVAKMDEAEIAPIEEREVTIDYGGFQAVFEIPGKASIENTGELKSVGIDSQKLDVDLFATSVPRLDQSAYLVAGLAYDGKTPLLPGTVLLSRDGTFIGKGHIPMISSGETHEFAFGIDDLVKIERVETDKLKGEAGFVTSVHTDERKFLTTVRNLHDFPMKVSILDRLPVSNHEDIIVEMSPGSTQPTRTNVDDRRGILEWANLVSARGEQVIEFGYKVEWPKDMNVSLVN